MKEKLLLFDVETTGVDPNKNGIIQLSGAIQVDNKTVGGFDLRTNILPGDEINNTALAVNGVTEEEIRQYPSAADIKKQFCDCLENHIEKYDGADKFTMVAYNAMFDYQFARRWFEKQGDKYFGSLIWNPPICVMVLAMQKLFPVRHKMENFKQATVARELGIEVDDDRLHDALYDLEIMEKIYNRLRNGGGQ